MIRTSSDFSALRAFDEALSRLGIEQDQTFLLVIWISMHYRFTYTTTEMPKY